MTDKVSYGFSSVISIVIPKGGRATDSIYGNETYMEMKLYTYPVHFAPLRGDAG